MIVKIFKWANIEKQCEKDVIMLKAFQDFQNQLIYCDWDKPNDIIKSFRTADIIVCEGRCCMNQSKK